MSRCSRCIWSLSFWSEPKLRINGVCVFLFWKNDEKIILVFAVRYWLSLSCEHPPPYPPTHESKNDRVSHCVWTPQFSFCKSNFFLSPPPPFPKKSTFDVHFKLYWGVCLYDFIERTRETILSRLIGNASAKLWKNNDMCFILLKIQKIIKLKFH